MPATKILQDGEWRVIRQYKTYRILHHCQKGVYSWDASTKMHDWVAVGRITNHCVACHAVPPEAMSGFINLLEWEM